jgi:hypothetical protein
LTWLARLGFVDSQGPALEGSAIHFLDGFLSPTLHFHETEAARSAGFAIHNHLGPRHGAMLLEGGTELVGRGAEWKVPHIQILRHDTLAAGRAGRHLHTEMPTVST